MRSAMIRLIKNETWFEIGNIHAAPLGRICSDVADEGDGGKKGKCCRHSKELLLAWHRLYMAQVEDELGEALPYWDWTKDEELPDLWKDIYQYLPLKPELKTKCGTKPFVERRQIVKLNSSKESVRVSEALKKTTFGQFSEQIDGPHKTVHSAVGCEMGTSDFTGYDPVFFLHHTFHDFLWAFWQEQQKHRSTEELYAHTPLIKEKLNEALPPFNNKSFNRNQKTMKHNRGVDVVDYQNSLCYEYYNLTFDGKSPTEFEGEVEGLESEFEGEEEAGTESEDSFKPGDKVEEEGKCREVCKKKYCKVACAADKYGKHYVEVLVGVVLPYVFPTGDHTFSLCQEGKCVNAGEVSTFGDDTDQTEISSQEVLDEKKFSIIETEVTELMAKEKWSFKKPLEAKMTSSSLPSNLPDPVVIIKKIGKKDNQGKVIFPPKDKQKRYGNLLDEYSAS